MKHDYASPGMHVSSAAERPVAGHGAPATYSRECTCGGRTTYQAAKRTDLDTGQGHASEGPKSSEALLAQAYRLQRGGDVRGATAGRRAYDPRSTTLRKKQSEALLIATREPQLIAVTFAAAPGLHEITQEETSIKARAVSGGKQPPPPERKPEGQ